MAFDAYTRGQDEELLWNLRPVHLVSPKPVRVHEHRAEAVTAGLRAAGPLTHLLVRGVPHPSGGQRQAASVVSSDLLLFIIDQMRGQHAAATASGSIWHDFGELKTAVSQFNSNRNAGDDAAAAAAPGPVAGPARPDPRHDTGASAGPAAPIAPPVRQPPLLPPINIADPFGGEAHRRPDSSADVEMADAFPAEAAAAAAASPSPLPTAAARSLAGDEGEASEQADGEFAVDEGEESSASPSGRDRADLAAEHGAGSGGRRGSRALTIPFSDLTPIDCNIEWEGHRLKIYDYTGADQRLQGKHLFDARPVLEALRMLKLSASSFHHPSDVLRWYKRKGYISRTSSVTVTGVSPPNELHKGRATFITHLAVSMLLRLFHRPVGSGAEELARVRPLVDSISRFANDSGQDSEEEGVVENEADGGGEGEERKENSAAPAAASKFPVHRIRLAELKSLVTVSWNGIAIDVYRYKGQIFYNFRDLFTELQRLGLVAQSGSVVQRTCLAHFHEKRMERQRDVDHQLVVTNAPHATGRGVVTFVSHALLLRILTLEHLRSATPDQLAKVQPLLDLIGQLALQPQGQEAKEDEPDGRDEDEVDSVQDDEEDDGGAAAAAASAPRRRQPRRPAAQPLHRPRDDESSSSEMDTAPDDERDEAYSPRAARPAAAGASASVQRAADAAFSDLVRVPTGIVWRGVAVDAYRYKGQGQLLWSMRLICHALGPKGMGLSGCQFLSEILYTAKTAVDGQRLIAAAGGGADSCSILVSGVPSPPDTPPAHRAASFFSSPVLLLILERLANLKENKAADVQKALKDMRQDVEDVERASR